MRQTLLPLLMVAAACGDAAPPQTTVTTLSDSAIAALPELTVTPASLVCTSLGVDGCPLRSAVANRLDDGRIAVWEPGFTVYAFAPGDTNGTPIGSAGAGGAYRHAVAVAQLGASRYQLILYGPQWRAMEIDDAGEITRVDTLPNPGLLTAIGYVGRQLIRQRMHAWSSDSGGRFTVTLLDKVTDTTGSTLLHVPLPWLRGEDPNAPPLPPLIASAPTWSLAPDGDVVWSPGDRLIVERRSPAGQVRWRIEGGPGPLVSEEDLNARESVVRTAAQGMPYAEEYFLGMRMRSDTLLPAVSGLTVTPAGDVSVARSVSPSRPVIDYLRLDPSGQPTGRFTLDGRIRILLAEGDSLLVHTPTESEPWEVRWMRVQ